MLRRVTFPSTLIVDHTAAKPKITQVVSTLGGKLEFMHNPPENKIMTRFGRMNDPTADAAMVRCLIDETILEQYTCNSFQLSKLLKRTAQTDNRIFIVQKLILNFTDGGSVLKLYYQAKDLRTVAKKETQPPLMFKITNKFHPNFQLPIKEEEFDQEELWKFEMRRVEQTEINRNRDLRVCCETLDGIAKLLYDALGVDCFDDLRLEFILDSCDQYWLYHMASQDFQEYLPLEDYNESPHKDKFIKVIVTD